MQHIRRRWVAVFAAGFGHSGSAQFGPFRLRRLSDRCSATSASPVLHSLAALHSRTLFRTVDRRIPATGHSRPVLESCCLDAIWRSPMVIGNIREHSRPNHRPLAPNRPVIRIAAQLRNDSVSSSLNHASAPHAPPHDPLEPRTMRLVRSVRIRPGRFFNFTQRMHLIGDRSQAGAARRAAAALAGSGLWALPMEVSGSPHHRRCAIKKLGRFIEAQNRAPIPLYLFYKSGAKEPEVLTQVLRPGMLSALAGG